MHFTDPFHVSTRIADKCNDGTLLLQVLYSFRAYIFVVTFLRGMKILENVSFLVQLGAFRF